MPKQTKGTVLSALPIKVAATIARSTKRLGSSCAAHMRVSVAAEAHSDSARERS